MFLTQKYDYRFVKDDIEILWAARLSPPILFSVQLKELFNSFNKTDWKDELSIVLVKIFLQFINFL